MAHNHYGSEAPSGENAVFEAERRLLQDRGHDVLSFERRSDEIRARGLRGLVTGALSTPWNPFAARRLRALLERERPDVLHVHNPFPLLSPAIFHAARGLPVATVWTLHNYRPFCAAATLMRDGAPCTECIDRRSPLPGVIHGCYRGSRAATLPLAAMIDLLGRTGTLAREVDAFVVLTDFQREMVIRAGLPAGARPREAELPPRSTSGEALAGARAAGPLRGPPGTGEGGARPPRRLVALARGAAPRDRRRRPGARRARGPGPRPRARGPRPLPRPAPARGGGAAHGGRPPPRGPVPLLRGIPAGGPGRLRGRGAGGGLAHSGRSNGSSRTA